MDLRLPFEKTPSHWKSHARIAGEAGEKWCMKNLDCPICNKVLLQYENNYPVKDFYCTRCKEEYQLKASKSFEPENGETITSSSFEKWYKAILNNNHPNLILIKYTLRESCSISESHENSFSIDNNLVSIRGHRIFEQDGYVQSVYLVKKEDINENCLVERNELSKVARRNGWKGSFLKIPGDKFTTIFSTEGQDVCNI